MARSARSLRLVSTSTKSVEAADSASPRALPAPSPTRHPTAGTLASVRADGRVLVRWSGQEEPVEAAIAAHVPRKTMLEAIVARAAVLLDFLDGRADRPVILALLRDRIDPEGDERTSFDLEDVTLKAPKNLVLECGESSITLNHTGRVTIRGTEVVSESTGAVKLKGAYVELN